MNFFKFFDSEPSLLINPKTPDFERGTESI